ncbi:hypothetical protein [Bacillus seohaeanensis]|uniref:Uncharacterized protein n=1 Tax=Bacillus seohaeanensis TaxID=284580 RepID=A0ABW5RT82_9BACI
MVQNTVVSVTGAEQGIGFEIAGEVIYPLVPQKRFLEIRGISGYMMFLCSDAAKGVTSQVR